MTTVAPAADTLAALAQAAGVADRWVNAHGQPQVVSPDTLRAVLGAMDLPAATPAQIRDSLAHLRRPTLAHPALTIV